MEAVIDRCRRAGTPLPTGAVLEAGCAMAGGAPCFHLVVRPDKAHALQAEAASLTFAGPDLVQTLLAYCEFRGIPLPQRAEKRLELFGGRLGLVMTLSGRKGEQGGAMSLHHSAALPEAHR